MLRFARLNSITDSSPALGITSATFALGLAVGAAIFSIASASGFRPSAQINPAPVQTRVSSTPPAGHPAEVLRIIDGDTFEARVHVWPGLDITTKVRLRGIDAPELKARCAEERSKAEASREALKAILAEGNIGVMHVSLDKYGGRVVANAATRTTPDVSAALLAKGYARAYSGGRRQGWCGGDAPG
jgi:endonuclease YncB( thermonuclease family)